MVRDAMLQTNEAGRGPKDKCVCGRYLDEHLPSEAFIPEYYAHVITTLDGSLKESAKVLSGVADSRGVSPELRVACQDGAVAIKTALACMALENRPRRMTVTDKVQNFLRGGRNRTRSISPETRVERALNDAQVSANDNFQRKMQSVLRGSDGRAGKSTRAA